jgi:hypothetical protein
MKLFFRLPGNDKRKPSALSGKGYTFLKQHLLVALILAPQGSALFAHRRLPMGKKRKTLCDLRASVVKYTIKDPVSVSIKQYDSDNIKYSIGGEASL